ncbi:hypothetical protein G6F31_021015 [Rhizopus arrhizus]|nr:hypothetical protein G6F31_021015 [Rhizopus arrhizus]
MQPIGGPVRRLVRAVPPAGTQPPAPHGLPGGLAVQDVIAAEEARAVGRGDRAGDGRRLPVDLATVESKQCERDRHYGDQREP